MCPPPFIFMGDGQRCLFTSWQDIYISDLWLYSLPWTDLPIIPRQKAGTDLWHYSLPGTDWWHYSCQEMTCDIIPYQEMTCYIIPARKWLVTLFLTRKWLVTLFLTRKWLVTLFLPGNNCDIIPWIDYRELTSIYIKLWGQLKLEPFQATQELSRPVLWLLCRDIGFVYPAMSMVVIGPSLLY
jgi:hypothetical protein